MATQKQWKQFYVSPNHILEFAGILMESELSNSIGRDGDYLLIDVGYDHDDEEHLDYIRQFQGIDDKGYAA